MRITENHQLIFALSSGKTEPNFDRLIPFKLCENISQKDAVVMLLDIPCIISPMLSAKVEASTDHCCKFQEGGATARPRGRPPTGKVSPIPAKEA